MDREAKFICNTLSDKVDMSALIEAPKGIHIVNIMSGVWHGPQRSGAI
jgi:hypothetical protein